MHVNGVLDSVDQWTIRSKLLSRETLRDEWDADFQKSYSKVVDGLTHSLAKEVFEKLHEILSNPYHTLPKRNAPLAIVLSLDIARCSKAKIFKEKILDAAELPPFKDWLGVFVKEAPEESRGGCKSLKFICEEKGGVDLDYFRENMSKIGRFVKEKLNKKLEEFTKKESNAQLKFRVEWHRNAEKNAMFGSIASYGEDNYISIKLWLEA